MLNAQTAAVLPLTSPATNDNTRLSPIQREQAGVAAAGSQLRIYCLASWMRFFSASNWL